MLAEALQAEVDAYIARHAGECDDRGRRLVVLVAQPKAVAIAVKGKLTRRRWSKLQEWLAVTPSRSLEHGIAG